MSKKNQETIEKKMNQMMDLDKWNKTHKKFDDLKVKKRSKRVLNRALIPETKTMPNQPDKICFIDLIEFLDNNEKRFQIGYYIRYKKGKFKGKFNIGGNALSVTKNDWVRLLAKALEEEIDLPDRADVRFIKENYRDELVQKIEQRNFQQLSDKEINYLIGCLIYRWNMYNL